MIAERQERVLEHGSWNIYKCQARQARTRAMHTSNAMHTCNALVLTDSVESVEFVLTYSKVFQNLTNQRDCQGAKV